MKIERTHQRIFNAEFYVLSSAQILWAKENYSEKLGMHCTMIWCSHRFEA